MKNVLTLSGFTAAAVVCSTGAAQPSDPRHAALKGFTVSVEDYPDSARKNNESGLVTVQFLVNMKGRVQDCQTVASTASLSLNNQTCSMAGRLRFKPALGENGKPTSEYWTWSIKWIDPVRRDISVGRLQWRSDASFKQSEQPTVPVG